MIVLGAAAVPLTYVLARRLGGGEERARAAAMLIAFSPAALLYGVTLDRCDARDARPRGGLPARRPGSRCRGRRGAVALAAASFFSWALWPSAASPTVVQLLRGGPRAALGMAVTAGVALAGFYLILYAATGFDPIGAIRAAGDAYDLGIANARPYLFWLFGSPVAFAVALGIPTAWYAARALGTADEAAIGLAAIVLVAVAIGLTKAETERIWLLHGPVCGGGGGDARSGPADARDLRASSPPGAS